MFVAIAIEELSVGMYVQRVTRQKGNLTVKSRGFIKTDKTISALTNKGILEVEIDLDKSKVKPVARDSGQVSDEEKEVLDDAPQNTLAEKSTANSQPRSELSKVKELNAEDLDQASALYSEAKNVQTKFIKSLRAGNEPDFSKLDHLSQDIIDSVIENKDSLSCLVMLKNADDYLVEHALNCSILLAMFASYKGFSNADIEDLTQAGLVMDIGMASLPKELLGTQNDFSAADWNVIRSHVDIGYELLERFGDAPPIVLDVVQNHHERSDGSGYPKGKTQEELSEYSQMAAIVDSYDAMISNRVYKTTDNAAEALQKLQTDPSMNADLVLDFINAIGLHPIGSLVKLESGLLGVICKRNIESPLKPTVMVFYDIAKQTHSQIKQIDLSQSEDEIVNGIRPEEFSVNLPVFLKTAFSPK